MAPVCFTEPWLPWGCHGNTPWEGALTPVWVDRVSRPIRSCQKDWRPSREPMAPHDSRGIHMLQLEPSAWWTALRGFVDGPASLFSLHYHFRCFSCISSQAFLHQRHCGWGENILAVLNHVSWDTTNTFDFHFSALLKHGGQKYSYSFGLVLFNSTQQRKRLLSCWCGGRCL